MEQYWKKFEMALRTSRLNTFAHLIDQECPKYGSKGSKKSAQRAYFELEGWTKIWNTTEDIRPDNVGTFFLQIKRVDKFPPWILKWHSKAKVDPNLIK